MSNFGYGSLNYMVGMCLNDNEGMFTAITTSNYTFGFSACFDQFLAALF